MEGGGEVKSCKREDSGSISRAYDERKEVNTKVKKRAGGKGFTVRQNNCIDKHICKRNLGVI